jgi:hypothetical protein
LRIATVERGVGEDLLHRPNARQLAGIADGGNGILEIEQLGAGRCHAGQVVQAIADHGDHRRPIDSGQPRASDERGAPCGVGQAFH